MNGGFSCPPEGQLRAKSTRVESSRVEEPFERPIGGGGVAVQSKSRLKKSKVHLERALRYCFPNCFSSPCCFVGSIFLQPTRIRLGQSTAEALFALGCFCLSGDSLCRSSLVLFRLPRSSPPSVWRKLSPGAERKSTAANRQKPQSETRMAGRAELSLLCASRSLGRAEAAAAVELRLTWPPATRTRSQVSCGFSEPSGWRVSLVLHAFVWLLSRFLLGRTQTLKRLSMNSRLIGGGKDEQFVRRRRRRQFSCPFATALGAQPRQLNFNPE